MNKYNGRTKTPEYSVWSNMRSRCTNPRRPDFAYYGGRGISYDPAWEDFATFVSDMGSRPTNSQLERRDNSASYSKANCFWATRVEQANNRRNNATVTYQGRTQTIAQWARESGITDRTLWMRLNKLGWPIERALKKETRLMRDQFLTFEGKTLTAVQWASIIGIKIGTLTQRLNQGWTVERALTQPCGWDRLGKRRQATH
jgi:hypothetical protein